MNIVRGNKIGTKVNVFINGELHSKDMGTNEKAKLFFYHVLKTQNNPTDENVDGIYEFLNENVRIAKAGGFEYDLKTNTVYMKGFNTPVPQKIIDTIEEYVEEGYPTNSITNFWKLLMANPDKRVREDLFEFISTHDFSITDKGYMIVYKTVNYKNKVDDDLASFISNSYIKIKDWKKSPNNYTVYKEYETTIERVLDGYYEWVEKDVRTFLGYKVSQTELVNKWLEDNEKDIEVVGVLSEMQENIEKISKEGTTFTDKYTGKMEIKLGVPVKQDRKLCDGNPKKDCSNGLHVGATKYVERFRGTTNKNDSPVLVCLVNPMHVVAVPEYDHSKMRVCKYYPFAFATVKSDNKIDIIKRPYFEDDYIVHEESELAEMLQKNSEEFRSNAMNVEEDNRDEDEYLHILETRVIDISSEKTVVGFKEIGDIN